ncbi:hypothetical protein DFQ26_000159 [Actinomortierella ambigua]|nr:hypothetical protein DFQ26_000159 [Actinomortierella ambigua]
MANHDPFQVRDAQESAIHPCPICHRDFHGDLPAFERHVNNHLDGTEEDNEPQQQQQLQPHTAYLVANDDHRPPLAPNRDQEDQNAKSRAVAMALAAEWANQADQTAADHQLAQQLQSEEQRQQQRQHQNQHYHQRDNNNNNSNMQLECEVPTCRALVSLSDMQRHMDHHLAQQLAQSGPAWIGGNTGPAKQQQQQQHGDSLILRILQEDGTLRDITVKQRKMEDTVDEMGASAAKKARLRLENHQSSSTGVDHPLHNQLISSPPPPHTTTITTGQTTMHGFFRQQPSANSIPNAQRLSSYRSTPPRVSSEACPGMLTDLIPRLRTLLQASIDAKATHEAYLADPSVAFCASDKTDKGWGCGYRNLQMMLSYVVQQPSLHAASSYSSSSHTAVDDIPLPTILNLQQQLEYAWRTLEIDPEGAAQLQRKVVGTRKWIGTTEAWTVLTSLGVRAQILDFHQPTGPNHTHPALFQAVLQYFQSSSDVELRPPSSSSSSSSSYNSNRSGSSHAGQGLGGGRRTAAVVQTRKPPLYLQHQGHSRTIVGIEVVRPGVYTLLVFDPSRKVPPQLLQVPPTTNSTTSTTTTTTMTTAGGDDNRPWIDRSLLRSFRLWLAAGYTKSQYQLLGISGLASSTSTSTSSLSSSPSPRTTNKLSLLTPNMALSVGWDARERVATKYPSSNRIP